MSINFQELDFQRTPLGPLVLRRRRLPHFPDQDIFEVKLNDEFLMTSIFHESEAQLAKLALAKASGENLNVVVGGLGLGYTAAAALEDPRVRSLTVVEYLQPVISWHQDRIVPLGGLLSGDPRCKFMHGDFFALSRDLGSGFGDAAIKMRDVILLDIDHTPQHHLHVSNKRFYSEEGLTELKSHLKPAGVFGLWADGPPDSNFADHLKKIFENVEAHLVEFKNPINNGTSKCAVYVATVS